MKHLPRVLLFMFLLTSLNSFANSVNFTNLNVNLRIFPNGGSGDNLGGTIFGTAVNLMVGGGTPFSWFNDFEGSAPGSVGGGNTTIFFDFAQGTLGSQFYDGGSTGINAADFNAGNFTFPTNGKDFTVSVPATLELVVVLGCTDSGVCTTYDLTTKPGKLVLSFTYDQGSGLYFGSAGYFANTPEPGTFGLVAIGISALAACKRKLTRGTT